MIDKKEEVNKLAVIILNEHGSLTARELYENIRIEHDDIHRNRYMRVFRRFAKVVNQFPDIEKEKRAGLCNVYMLKNKL